MIISICQWLADNHPRRSGNIPVWSNIIGSRYDILLVFLTLARPSRYATNRKRKNTGQDHSQIHSNSVCHVKHRLWRHEQTPRFQIRTIAAPVDALRSIHTQRPLGNIMQQGPGTFYHLSNSTQELWFSIYMVRNLSLSLAWRAKFLSAAVRILAPVIPVYYHASARLASCRDCPWWEWHPFGAEWCSAGMPSDHTSCSPPWRFSTHATYIDNLFWLSIKTLYITDDNRISQWIIYSGRYNDFL